MHDGPRGGRLPTPAAVSDAVTAEAVAARPADPATTGTSAPRRTGLLRVHRLGPVVPLLLGLYGLVAAHRLTLGGLTDPGPGLWPFLVALLITATAAVLLVVDDRDDYETWTRGTAGIAGGLVSLGLFIVLFELLGFLVPAVLLLLLWLKVFAEEPWRWAVPLALGGAALLHLVFVEALGVPFPQGVLLATATLSGSG